MTWISAVICADCWTQRNPDREPVRVSHAYREADVCHVCRAITYSGIYVRAYYPESDPTTWEQPTPDHETIADRMRRTHG